MKIKISFIAVLAAVLALIFTACTELGANDDGSGPYIAKNPVVAGKKYFEVTGRTSDYFTFDILADVIKSGKGFTIKGGAPGATGSTMIRISTTGGSAITGITGSPINATDKDKEVFTLAVGNTIVTADIDAAIRFYVATGQTFYIYEIELDGYKLSTDTAFQALAAGADPFSALASDSNFRKNFTKAGSPTIRVWDPTVFGN